MTTPSGSECEVRELLSRSVVSGDLGRLRNLCEAHKNSAAFMEWLHTVHSPKQVGVEYEICSTLLILAIKGRERVAVSAFGKAQKIKFVPNIMLVEYLVSVGCNPDAEDVYQDWNGVKRTSAWRYARLLRLPGVVDAVKRGLQEFQQKQGDLFKRRALLKAVLESDWDNVSAMIEEKNAEGMDLLLNCRVQSGDLPTCHYKGQSVLQLAVAMGEHNIIEGILKHGARVVRSDRLLMILVENVDVGTLSGSEREQALERAYRLAKLLLDHGCGVGDHLGFGSTFSLPSLCRSSISTSNNATSSQGVDSLSSLFPTLSHSKALTPLLLAVEKDFSPQLIELLVAWGAHPRHRRNDGNDAQYLMNKRGMKHKYSSRCRANAILEAMRTGTLLFVERVKLLILSHTSLLEGAITRIILDFMATDGDQGLCLCGCDTDSESDESTETNP